MLEFSINKQNKFIASQSKKEMNLTLIVPPRTQYKQIDNRWSEIKMSSPFSPRCAFGFCYKGQMGYIYGGYNVDQGTLGDMFTAKFNDSDDRNWYPLEQKGKQIPGKLKNHTLASYLSFLICVGGQKNQMDNNGYIFKYNLKNNYWSKVDIGTQNNQELKYHKELLKVDSHGCFSYQNYLYIFGGYLPHQGQHSNHLLRLSLDTLQTQNKIIVKQLKFQQNQLIPPPRRNFAYCVLNDEAYIFGGANEYEILDDFWKLNLATQQWSKIILPLNDPGYWPERRKGAVLVPHQQSLNLILFGGIQQVTKQFNDLSIYLTRQQKWVKIHSNTNNIYNPSPTIKHQLQTSPTMLNHRFKKIVKDQFKIGVQSIQCQDSSNSKTKLFKQNSTKNSFKIGQKYKSLSSSHEKKLGLYQTNQNEKSLIKTRTTFSKQSQKYDQPLNVSFNQPQKQGKVSIVQQKKYRKFLERKKKLLSQIFIGYENKNQSRSFSPTSQCLNYTLKKLGQQPKFIQSKNPQFILPKVIFDDHKSEVIGKKPCARDGHSAFGCGQNMYIIGGDRHTVSFNDTHLLRMDKAIQSLSYYT